MTYYIYYLFDPLNSSVPVYIGMTNNPQRRLKEHIRQSKKEQNIFTNWITKLLTEGREPDICVLEETTFALAPDREIYWITYYGMENLLNRNPGGNHFHNPDHRVTAIKEAHRRRTPEARRKLNDKIRKAVKSALAKRTPEQKEKFSLLKSKQTKEYFENLSEEDKAKWLKTRTESTKKYYANWTEQDRIKFCKAKEKQWAKVSKEVRAKLGKLSTERHNKRYSKMTPEQKVAYTIPAREGAKRAWEERREELTKIMGEKNRRWWNNATPEQKEARRQKLIATRNRRKIEKLQMQGSTIEGKFKEIET